MRRVADSTVAAAVAIAIVAAAAVGVAAPFRRLECKSSPLERVIQFHGTTPGIKKRAHTKREIKKVSVEFSLCG